jgi:hypothetical protein
MIRAMKRLLFLCAAAALLVGAPLHAAGDDRASAPPRGVRVVTAAHSFHVWMPPILKELAESAGIQGHEMVAVELKGGSKIIEHWNLRVAKAKLKPVLVAGKADVLTLSPIYLPDPGIENYVKLGLEHNPALRITVQEFWLPFDERARWAWRGNPAKRQDLNKVDHDARPLELLRAEHATYFHEMDEHIRALNEQIGHPAIFIVPVGQAVLALREKVLKGEVPGVTKQSQLFKDAVGHPQAHIQALAAYCHYAVIYGRNPAGLKAPSVIARQPEVEKLNALLQQLAWQAVTAHPLSAVKP